MLPTLQWLHLGAASSNYKAWNQYHKPWINKSETPRGANQGCTWSSHWANLRCWVKLLSSNIYLHMVRMTCTNVQNIMLNPFWTPRSKPLKNMKAATYWHQQLQKTSNSDRSFFLATRPHGEMHWETEVSSARCMFVRYGQAAWTNSKGRRWIKTLIIYGQWMIYCKSVCVYIYIYTCVYIYIHTYTCMVDGRYVRLMDDTWLMDDYIRLSLIIMKCHCWKPCNM